MINKFGLVLAGGGGKGAYQVGVWKYLTEVGIAENISVLSGASVGALNAVLFTLVSCKTAELIWTRAVEDKILAPHEKSFSTIDDGLSFITKGFFDTALSSFGSIAENGIWSRDGLLEIMQSIPLENLHHSKSPPVYAACTAVLPKFGTEYFRLNGYDVPQIRKILLASSAIPLVFRPESIDGTLYLDGGLTCNVPLAPLIRRRCTLAIVIALSDDAEISPAPPSQMSVITIHPSEPLGKLDTLNFSSERMRHLIRLGYEDARRILCRNGCLLRF
ncbi:MAG: patatin-like phospholipase family protein [Treponema sp.]